ncbi:peptidoglycan DD-metalloendopeptidase family protein [Chitinispirillales bacterium ANBcel5]|uniref:murein hydrolase activator EnvC family protein n=1 Tax=Cellulosispirillum alkaliphilum TaxID=3039283 RepID=UPI002A50C8D1|nr:peptidoglycan DD-metalloendopeptidase family protein [Chitinispirillales bacterium ANBcel5]
MLISSLLVGFITYGQNREEQQKSIQEFESEILEKKTVLDSIQAELEKGRTQLSKLQQQEGNYLSRLLQLEKNIDASQSYIDMLSEQIDTVTVTIELLGDSLGSAEEQLEENRELMARRLRRAYMRGEYNVLQVLLKARSPVEFVHKIKYLQELNNYDRRLAESIRQMVSSIERKRISQENRQIELKELYETRVEEQQILLEEEASRRAMLEQIRSEKSDFAQIVSELEAAQRELEGMIENLDIRRKQAREELERRVETEFKELKGKLPWPVQGEIVTEYGKITHPIYQTVIMNNGIGIKAPKGKDVKCVAEGTVAYTGWMRGLGRLVIVEHQGGYISIYAHLGEITVQEDKVVKSGTVLGKVGESGSAEGSKLHFELRKSSETLNPTEWLR